MKRISLFLAILLATNFSYAQTNMPKNEHWKLQWTQPVDEIKSTAYMFQHIKSGVPLLYRSNEDDNKVFCIAFRTPPTNSTGIAIRFISACMTFSKLL